MENPAPSATKSVSFALSPQSSRTLRKHHSDQEERSATSRDEDRESDADSKTARPRRPGPPQRRRSGSDPSSDRPRRRRGRDGSPRSDEDEVEVLPDRFDSAGRPVDANDPRRVHSRTGDFEYRPRDRDGGPHVQGAWGIHGTDPEMVNKMAQGVGSLLQGRQGWMGLVGNLLTSLPASSNNDGGGGGRRDGGRSGHGMIEDDRDDVDDEYDDGRRRRQRRQRRRRDDDDY